MDAALVLARMTVANPALAPELAKAADGEPEAQNLINSILAADPTAEPPKRYRLLHASRALQPQPPIEWVIDRLLSIGSVSLVVGEGGSKKTWAMLDAAVCVALGLPWLEMETTQCAVLFIDEESGPRRLERRLAEVMRAHYADETISIHYTSLAGFNLREPADELALQEAIDESGARLVIIDALADVMPGGDENAVKDVQPIFIALRRIAEATQSAVVVIHHANKSGSYRGSTAMKGAVDLMLLIESKPDSSNIDFSIEKARDVEPFKFAATIRFDVDRTDLVRAEVVNADKPLSKSQAYVMRYLAEHGNSTMSEIKAHADTCSENAARLAVYQLVDMEKVRRVDDGGQGKDATFGLTGK